MVYDLILATDSRAYRFHTYCKPKEETDSKYTVHYCVSRGATIQDLRQELLQKLQNTNSALPLVIKIAGGINDLTERIQLQRSYVLIPSNKDITVELLDLKAAIKDNYNAIVTFIPIPPVIFEVSQKHKLDNGMIQTPKFNEHELNDFQRQHLQVIGDINNDIEQWNKEPQLGIIPQTASWNNLVHRPTKKHQRSGLLRTTRRLDKRSLYDGVHGIPETKLKWFNMFHHSVQKEIEQLNQVQG